MASLNAVFQGGFDATTVEPDAGRDFTPLPAGAYDVEITNSEVKDAKSGKGCYLALEFTIFGEQGAGRKVWSNVTLRNENAQAEQIGQAQLSALCRAVGINKLEDTDQLFQKTLRVRLKVVPPQGSYAAKNEVTAYESIGSGAPAPSAARPAANASGAKPAATSGTATPPWAKKR